MHKLVPGQSRKRGLPPGTPVFVGQAREEAPEVTLFDYDEAQFRTERVTDIAGCASLKDKPSVTWINASGLHDVGLIQSLSEAFGLHPLVQEDILNTNQRPKVEDHGDYLYVVLRMLQWSDAAGEAVAEQVSLVLGRGFVLSFQERAGDVFDSIRDRIRAGKGRIRKMGADYLAYSLIDAVVDAYFVVLEKQGEKLEALEEELTLAPDRTTLRRINALKREVLLLRKSVWPLREVLSGLERTESGLLSDGLGIYLRDAYDHTIQIVDTIETFRDLLASTFDTYLSALSNRTNEVMKLLTIVATIFIPLTFIVGIYGMNFKYMPELDWAWGYAAVLLLMAVVAGAMVLYFRRKKWL